MSDPDDPREQPAFDVTRRDFLRRTTTGVAGAAIATGHVVAAGEAGQNARTAAQRPGGSTARAIGPLYPQQNQFRNLVDLSGLWDFQLDPKDEGEKAGWTTALPAPRTIAVPCSWNDLFDDAKNYLGLAWYSRQVFVPPGWRGQRVVLRVGSAVYAARVWVNGTLVAEHLGGHLPFAADVTPHVAFDKPNTITIAVENKPLPERVPAGPSPSGGIFSGLLGGYPETTYDFFPYSGLQRPVLLYSVPITSIDDVTAATAIEGKDGVVKLTVSAGDFTGKGNVRVNGQETPLTFRQGAAEATLRVAGAEFWSPATPRLYPLTVTLSDATKVLDSYTVDVGIRTIEVRGDRLLLNGEPVFLKGFGKHEDFAINGRGLNVPLLVRDYELLRWVGANSFRTSHYPYSEEAMMLADKLGVLVIDETPAVSINFGDTDELLAKRLTQTSQALRELVARDKNHPSVIMWCVANEPMAGNPLAGGNPPATVVDAGVRFFQSLFTLAHELDATRPVTMVGVQGGPPQWLSLFDVVCLNRYYGWYFLGGRLEQAIPALEKELDALHASMGKPMMLAEFGADTIAGQHSQPGEMWSEEYQADLVERYLDAASKRPFMVGMHVWNFADFKTGQGIMRASGMNLKGVFTRDRKPKMAAHALRRRWSQKQ